MLSCRSFFGFSHFDLDPPFSGNERVFAFAMIDKPQNRRQRDWFYATLIFILLARLVRRKSGKKLDELVRDEVFNSSRWLCRYAFDPPASWADRIAPTEGRP